MRSSTFLPVFSAIVFPVLLGILGCESAETMTPPDEHKPAVEVFTGGLYVQGGSTVDLKFSVTAETADAPIKQISLSIGESDSASLQLNTTDPKNMILNGVTQYTTTSTSNGYTSTETTDVLDVALKIKTDEIVGATPYTAGADALIWNTTLASGADGSVKITGTITANSGESPVDITYSTDGAIDGKLSINGKNVIINGYLDEKDKAMAPPQAVLTMLIISALHTQRN